MAESFYSAMASASFALLGLWWVVVQIKREELIADQQQRRHAYSVTLYFLLPGLMSLLALLSEQLAVLWRFAFITAGVAGLAEVGLSRGPADGSVSIGRTATALIYLGVIIVAVLPFFGVTYGLPPLVVEGILLSCLLALGVHFVWEAFTAPPTRSGPSLTKPEA